MYANQLLVQVIPCAQGEFIHNPPWSLIAIGKHHLPLKIQWADVLWNISSSVLPSWVYWLSISMQSFPPNRFSSWCPSGLHQESNRWQLLSLRSWRVFVTPLLSPVKSSYYCVLVLAGLWAETEWHPIELTTEGFFSLLSFLRCKPRSIISSSSVTCDCMGVVYSRQH